MKKILLITPPFTQLNTPYPATAYLKGFLNTKNISSFQIDLGLELILKLFSKQGLSKCFQYAEYTIDPNTISENAKRILSLKNDYINTVDTAIAFLQGIQPSFARLICSPDFLPKASRFNQSNDIEWAFGHMGFQDKAKHLATLYLEDLSDFIGECVDPSFGFSRYAEQLGRYANSFDEIYNELKSGYSFIDKLCISILDLRLKSLNPDIVCFTIPFAGNLLSAFRCAQYIKAAHYNIKIVFGGGFPNTELRSMSDVRVFEFVDYLTLDDGELPLELIIDNVRSYTTDKKVLKRTFIIEEKKVAFIDNSKQPDYKMSEKGTPDYADLLLNKYISVIEVTNPMHSLWSDGRWNKLTITQGCYWAQCTFCDCTLPYIKNFDSVSASILVTRMEQILQQTGENSFHFVDEAAHPKVIKLLALEILRRDIKVTWWTNIRFEKSFTYDICLLLKASGCIAVSGGLEIASNRLLGLINKGVSVEQVARVTQNFTKAGIMVHAYLMYGYPSQTEQETIDSLEMVRQLFEQGCLQSGFWHQFALTAHSPIIQNFEQYGILPEVLPITFANNDVSFTDKTGIDHSKFSEGLRKALYNYMLDLGYDMPLQNWFNYKIPKTKVDKHYIYNTLTSNHIQTPKPNTKLIWLGNVPQTNIIKRSKKGRSWETLDMLFHTKTKQVKISLNKDIGEWFVEKLKSLSFRNTDSLSFGELKADFETYFDDFELFWHSKPIQKLKALGLICI